MKLPLKLSVNVMHEVCKYGYGSKQCKYVILNMDRSEFVCGKVMQTQKMLIDEETDRLVREYKNTKRDDTKIPVGDNCPGYLGDVMFNKLSPIPLDIICRNKDVAD
jgi:hypothetical protein